MRGALFRQVPAGGDPLFRPEHPADGRWQRGEVVEGFYLAEDEQTAWGEWYRALSELAVPPMRQMPRELWRFDVRVEGVADLSNADRLATVGLPLPVPARGQWPRFQAVGEALASGGWRGVLYPSASRAAGSRSNLALCLFRRAPGIPGVDPVVPPTRHDEPPAPPPQAPQPHSPFVAGELSLDYSTHEVRVRGEVVRLTPTEYRLLEELVRHAGTILPHRVLLERVWGPKYVGDAHYLKVFVRRLRRKLGDDPERPRYIHTEWGIGYRFASPR